MLAGRDHERDRPPGPKNPFDRHDFGRQDAKDVGCSNRSAGQGAHGPSCAYTRRLAWTAGICDCERRGRWRLPRIYDGGRLGAIELAVLLLHNAVYLPTAAMMTGRLLESTCP